MWWSFVGQSDIDYLITDVFGIVAERTTSFIAHPSPFPTQTNWIIYFYHINPNWLFNYIGESDTLDPRRENFLDDAEVYGNFPESFHEKKEQQPPHNKQFQLAKSLKNSFCSSTISTNSNEKNLCQFAFYLKEKFRLKKNSNFLNFIWSKKERIQPKKIPKICNTQKLLIVRLQRVPPLNTKNSGKGKFSI